MGPQLGPKTRSHGPLALNVGFDVPGPGDLAGTPGAAQPPRLPVTRKVSPTRSAEGLDQRRGTR
ncbi:hypothetical protein GCM10009593_19340 [Microlunatus antarcticus]